MDCSDSYSEYSEEFDFYDSVENAPEVIDDSHSNNAINDPEYVEYSCLDISQVEHLFKELIDKLSRSTSIPASKAKLLLHLNKWDVENAKIDALKTNNNFVAHNCSSIQSTSTSTTNGHANGDAVHGDCPICCDSSEKRLISLGCKHLFCDTCWWSHFHTQLQNGISSKIECMSTECHVICMEGFAFNVLQDDPTLLDKYKQMTFRDYVISHPHLRWCTGRGCNIIIYCKTNKGHRVTCSSCNSKYCFLCGQNYHAPASCEITKRWLVKCADDSETANYISAHTKDCPNCHSCIEKNGGCNHMQCSKCKYHFCWMCFRDWKSHGSEYYECSRYKENPAIAQEANHLKARRALEKYLHYYERFENHNKSLKMEDDMRLRIKAKIEEKISQHEGTWIDWQYLHTASHLLTKCRYTLQYTYPFAYYMETSARKELFEYQQAQLEKEIEELSWKVERAETTDRGDLENQMHIAEQKRRTLLQDFFE